MLGFIVLHSAWTKQIDHSQSHQDVPSDSIVQLLESNADGVIIKIEIPDFQFGTMEHEGEQYQTISFPGCGYTAEAGKPQLPVTGTLLGVPIDAEFNLQILESDYSTYLNYKIYPVPKFVIHEDELFNEYSDSSLQSEPLSLRRVSPMRTEFYLDKQFYAINGFYPHELVELGFTGFIRDSKVLQVQFNPVQYNPATQTVKLYSRLIARVTFRRSNMAPASNQGLPRPESRFYENILSQNILNYNSAKNWKKIPTSDFRLPTSSAAPAWNPALLLSSSPAYKIIVDSDGMYHITYEQLKEEEIQNLDEIDPRTFKLFNKGKQVPIFVRGENDGSFDEEDEIIFHGLRNAGTKTYYDFFSDENVYWLYWNGPPGLRMVKRSANFVAEDAQLYRKYRSLVHTEFDNTFQRFTEATEYKGAEFVSFTRSTYKGVYKRVDGVLTMPPLPNDSWYWDVVSSPNIKQFEFQLPNVAETSLNATVRVMLRGRTTHAAPIDHHTQVWLNEEVMLEDAKWDGQSEHFIERQDISHDFLRSGKNIISVLSPGDTEAKDVDQVLFNWIEVEYWREFTVVDDYLEFSAPLEGGISSEKQQNFRLTISNFSHPDIEIYGTDGSIYVDNLVQEDIQKPGTYQVRFLASQPSESKGATVQYIALTTDKLKSPKKIIKDEPSNLRLSTNGADYIIITHESLYPGVLPLAEWRQKSTQGLRVEVVKVQDIYDEFNFGIFNPNAIKDFLAYAYSNWQPPAPTYVVLAGDASYEYKKTVNLVPINLVQTIGQGIAASDGSYVTISGNDSLPDMLISRLPARNLIELDAMVSKIIAYESSPEMGPWRKKLLFLGGVGPDFAGQSEGLIKNYVPPSFEVARIYSDDPKSEYYGGGQEVIDGINNGALIVNFLGHGGGSIWSDNRMLGLEDIPLLENGQKLPFVISMTCYTGYFDNPHGSSLSEDMIKSENGGAIAFYGSTGLGWLTGDYNLASEIFASIFKSNITTIGQIITNAEIQFLAKNPYYLDLIEIYNLFGDSALALGGPKLPVSLDVTPSVDEGGILQVRGIISDLPAALAAQAGQTFNGKAEITVSDSTTKKISYVTEIDVLNGRFEVNIPSLPLRFVQGQGQASLNGSHEIDTEPSVGIVQAYVWNDVIDGMGYKTYTIGGPDITNVRTEPEVIPPNEPVHILSEIKSANRVKSVICYYRTSSAKDWSQIEMERFSGDIFKTVSPIPECPAGTFIYYYIEAIDSRGQKSRTPNQTFRVASNPDLVVSQSDIKWTLGTPSILSATVKNIGQQEAKNVIVRFFNGPPENRMQIGTDKVIPGLKPDEAITVQLEWQPEENKQTVFVVVDPPLTPPSTGGKGGEDEFGQIVESNESNNIASREFFRDKFVLTPAQGSNGLISSVDGNLFFQLPQGAIAEDAVLTIEKKDNVDISEQPDLKYASIRSRKSEEGTAYQLNITPMTSAHTRAFAGSGETDALHITAFDARLMIKYDSSASDVNRLGIYLMDEETRKWLYVGGERLNDTIAASISAPGLYALMENNDNTPPRIEITFEHQGFIEGSYISETPIISARITDENGIDTRPNRLLVLLDGVPVDSSEYTYSASPTKSNLVLLSYAPTLSPGTHNISIVAFDANNLSAQKSISGEVAEELKIKNVANYPNPFEPGPKEKNKGTIFAYILTTQVDKLTLKIYTSAGRLVKSMDNLDAFADYNEYHWNGKDEDDEELSNGVYFYKLIAEKDKKRVEKIGKLAVLR
jgi:hypothetical protein